jgi:hypothetical protein
LYYAAYMLGVKAGGQTEGECIAEGLRIIETDNDI